MWRPELSVFSIHFLLQLSLAVQSFSFFHFLTRSFSKTNLVNLDLDCFWKDLKTSARKNMIAMNKGLIGSLI